MPAVHQAIDVAATPDECWRTFADLATWPSWFPLLRSVRALDGDGDPWRLGARLRMVFALGPARLPVTVAIEELEPRKRVRWVGGGLGVRGDHWYALDSRAPGVTRFTSHEDFSGFGAKLMIARVRDFLDDEAHRSMERFKAMVEARK